MKTTRDDWADLIRPLLGAPFAWGGRGPEAYDCWGVVAAVLTGLGRPVPGDWISDQAGACRIMEAEVRSPRWRHLLSPITGAVVAMSTRQAIHHVGIVTPFGILTTTEALGVIVAPEGTLRRQGYHRIEYYQWVGPWAG
jgi:cell wall-associated NlpC family hydrolase